MSESTVTTGKKCRKCGERGLAAAFQPGDRVCKICRASQDSGRHGDLPGETWRAWGADGMYEASNLGRVRSLFYRGGKREAPYVLKQVALKGYLRVQVYRSPCRGRSAFVHRIVLEAFVGPRPDNQECRHKDGDQTNNRLDNLCWGTRLENIEDKRRHGTLMRGERCTGARLSPSVVVRIREELGAGSEMRPLAQRFGVSTHTIWAIKHRRTWAWV